MLNQWLFIASDRWEQQQTARAIRNAEHLGDGELGRDYMLLMSARGTLENPAIQKLKFLLRSEDLWLLFRDSHLTVRLRADATRMLSKALAQIDRLLSREHKRVSFNIFGAGQPSSR